MIYVFAKDDRGLTAYSTEQAAIAACEGIDVEDGNYRFFSNLGWPMRARFTRPNRRGPFAAISGSYVLEPEVAEGASDLKTTLPLVRLVSGCGLQSVDDVLSRLGANALPNKSLERGRGG